MTERETLYELGNVYVTQSAARTYADARGLQQEEARRELTGILLDARESRTPGSWRRRANTPGVDVTARVVPDETCPDLAVVVAISVRPYSSTPSRAQLERRRRRREASGDG